MTDDTYEKLKTKETNVYSVLQWHFEKLLKAIHRNITTRESLRQPWTVEVKREIKFGHFYEFF